MKTVLQAEAQKILDAGHLAPLYLGRGDRPRVQLLHVPGARPDRHHAGLGVPVPDHRPAVGRPDVRADRIVHGGLRAVEHQPQVPRPGRRARREYSGPTKVWYWADFWDGTKLAAPPWCISTLYGVWLYAYRTGDWTVVDNNWSAITSYYSANSGEANIYGTMCPHRHGPHGPAPQRHHHDEHGREQPHHRVQRRQDLHHHRQPLQEHVLRLLVQQRL